MSFPTLPDLGVALVLSLAAKATLLLVLAGGVVAVATQRTSAATRHLVWTLAVASLLALPLLTLVLPRWRIEAPAAPIPTALIGGALPSEPTFAPTLTEGTAVELQTAYRPPPGPTPESRPPFPWRGALLFAYLCGSLVLLVRLGVERTAMRSLERGAQKIDDPQWTGLVRELEQELGVRERVTLRRGVSRMTPMTWGTRRPTILLPAEADEWSEDRRRAVLLHELAHVARRDCLTQTLAELANTFYWFHPGVWWASRRLRVERELACDDRVLAAGARPEEYAGHLLEIAHTLHSPRRVALALGMARPSQLEGRLLAILDRARSRSLPGRHTRVLTATVATVVLAVVASAGVAESGTTSGSPPRVVEHSDGRLITNEDVEAPLDSRKERREGVVAKLLDAVHRNTAEVARSEPVQQQRDTTQVVLLSQDGLLRLVLDRSSIRLEPVGDIPQRSSGPMVITSQRAQARAFSGDTTSQQVSITGYGFNMRADRMEAIIPLASLRDVEYRNEILYLVTPEAADPPVYSDRLGTMVGMTAIARLVLDPEQARAFVLEARRRIEATRTAMAPVRALPGSVTNEPTLSEAIEPNRQAAFTSLAGVREVGYSQPAAGAVSSRLTGVTAVGYSQQATGSVTGWVSNREGEPIAGASIEVTWTTRNSQPEEIVRTTRVFRTDSAGQFNITGVPATYNGIRISAPGYQDASSTINLSGYQTISRVGYLLRRPDFGEEHRQATEVWLTVEAARVEQTTSPGLTTAYRRVVDAWREVEARRASEPNARALADSPQAAAFQKAVEAYHAAVEDSL